MIDEEITFLPRLRFRGVDGIESREMSLLMSHNFCFVGVEQGMGFEKLLESLCERSLGSEGAVDSGIGGRVGDQFCVVLLHISHVSRGKSNGSLSDTLLLESSLSLLS